MRARDRFEFFAGSPALCLVDTFGKRGGEGVERLNTPNDLVAWLRAAGFPTDGIERVTEQEVDNARRLREAVYRCGLSVIDRRPLAGADIDVINRAAARPPLRPQMVGGALIQTGDAPVEAALSVLAADALHVLGTALRERIRLCPDCRMMFFDTSRPGRRRWCSSASGCGNRAKVRNLRARRARQASGSADDE